MDETFCENVNINCNKTKNVDVKVQLLALNKSYFACVSTVKHNILV